MLVSVMKGLLKSGIPIFLVFFISFKKKRFFVIYELISFKKSRISAKRENPIKLNIIEKVSK